VLGSDVEATRERDLFVAKPRRVFLLVAQGRNVARPDDVQVGCRRLRAVRIAAQSDL